MIGGALQDYLRARRHLRATARLLIHELERLTARFEDILPDGTELKRRLEVPLRDYKNALFEVDQATFDDHYPIYVQAVDALEFEPEGRQLDVFILDTRRRLRVLLNDETPP